MSNLNAHARAEQLAFLINQIDDAIGEGSLTYTDLIAAIESAMRQVQSDEREACAEVVNNFKDPTMQGVFNTWVDNIAAAIRQRGTP